MKLLTDKEIERVIKATGVLGGNIWESDRAIAKAQAELSINEVFEEIEKGRTPYYAVISLKRLGEIQQRLLKNNEH